MQPRRTARHGNARREGRTPEYVAWQSMKSRCGNPQAQNYRHYGGRGIEVCQRWQESFEAFLADMGERPSPKHSLDRIDNDGNYEPGNCRWATQKTQLTNRRTGRPARFPGLSERIRRAGLTNNVVYARLRRGWDLERALSTPALPHGANQHTAPWRG